MAVAAFKATTRSRRTCNIRGVEVEVPSTPHSRNTSPVRRSRPSSSPVKRMPSSSSTPRSRPASPTKQQQFAKQNDRMHRRTRSFVDLSSSRYFTDSSSLAAAENPGGCRSSSGLRSSAHHLASGSEVSFSPSVSIILSVYPNILGKCVSIIMQQSCHCWVLRNWIMTAFCGRVKQNQGVWGVQIREGVITVQITKLVSILPKNPCNEMDIASILIDNQLAAWEGPWVSLISCLSPALQCTM